MEFVITKNERLKGIEVDFVDGKPGPSVIQRLKASGLRWSPKIRYGTHVLVTIYHLHRFSQSS